MNVTAIGALIFVCLVVGIVIGAAFDTTLMHGASVIIGGDMVMGAAALGITGLLFTFLMKLSRELSEIRERLAKFETG